jgi:hypothetical protein
VIALIVVSSVTLATGALVDSMTSNERPLGREQEATAALHAADAGLKNAISVLAQKDPMDGLAVGDPQAAVSPTSFTLDHSYGTYSATKTATDTWTITAIGMSPDGRIMRQLEEQVRASSSSRWVVVPGTRWQLS